MKKELTEKKKQELAKRPAIVFKEEHYFFDTLCRAFYVYDDNINYDMTVIYCMHCGTYGEKPDFSLSCANCGAKIEASHERRAFTLYKATYQERADGSRVINIILRELRPIVFFRGRQKDAFIKTRYASTSVVISANGQTYCVTPVWLDSHKKVNVYSADTMSIRNITFASPYAGFYSSNRVISALTAKAVDYFIEKGYLTKFFAFNNRFRNLQDENVRRYMLSLVCGNAVEYNGEEYPVPVRNLNFSYFIRYQRKIVRLVRPDSTELDMITAFRDTFHLPKSKKFNRMLIKRPTFVTLSYLLFRRLGFKDINNFYRLCRLDSEIQPILYLFSKCSHYTFGIKLIRKYIKERENAVTRELEKEFESFGFYQTMLYDVLNYADEIINRHYPFEQVQALFHGSILDVHDALMRIYKNLKKTGQEILGSKTAEEALTLIQENGDVLTDDEKKEYLINYALSSRMPIPYTEKDKELVSTHDGIDFVLPTNLVDLVDAGMKLHNCVGDCYLDTTLFRISTIVLMKEREKLVGCIELTKMEDGTWLSRQAYASCNKLLCGVYETAYRHWCSAHQIGMVTKDSFYYDYNRNIDVSDFIEVIRKEVNRIIQGDRKAG